ncbi:MAG: MaoC family dehydratase N-terminal domain-containing protein [Dehalococcoidia bacterium]|nr:MaoC family dehydratase N-terminal domain-containing protein [Dehalococcoidia bacterium]MCA9850653.1 MaoC family dehydratase N-terminal domain-containing protein [Dehalococcoidia bacterium]
MTNADDEPVLTAEIRAWIGREGPEESAEVTQREIERYAHAVGNLSPLFLDEAVAADSPFGGLVAPFQFYSIPFIDPLPHAALEEDGIATAGAGGLRPPIPLPRTMAGGQEVEYARPIRPGDVLTRRSRISGIDERPGSTGPLVFTTTETTYRDAAGEVVVVVRSTSISR